MWGKASAHNLSVQAVLSQKKLFSWARRESKPRLPPVIRSSLKNIWPRRESNPRLPRRLYSTVVFRQNNFLEISDKNSYTVFLNKYYPRIMNFRGRLHPGTGPDEIFFVKKKSWPPEIPAGKYCLSHTTILYIRSDASASYSTHLLARLQLQLQLRAHSPFAEIYQLVHICMSATSQMRRMQDHLPAAIV